VRISLTESICSLSSGCIPNPTGNAIQVLLCVAEVEAVRGLAYRSMMELTSDIVLSATVVSLSMHGKAHNHPSTLTFVSLASTTLTYRFQHSDGSSAIKIR
jgi:hypothetical protein